MVTKHFAEATFRPISSDGVAHGGPRCDKTSPRNRGSGRDIRRTRRGPQNKTAALVAAACGTDPREFPRPSQVRCSSETHDSPAVKRDAGGGVGSDYGKALAAFAAAGVDHRAATTGSHAGAKPDLAGALFVMWSEGGLHRFKSLKGSAGLPDAISPVKDPNTKGFF